MSKTYFFIDKYSNHIPRYLSVSGLEPDFRTDLYKGAEHSGWKCFLVDKDDNPVVAINRGKDSEVWFSLR